MDLITITGIESIKLDSKTGEVIYITPAFKICKPKGSGGNISLGHVCNVLRNVFLSKQPPLSPIIQSS